MTRPKYALKSTPFRGPIPKPHYLPHSWTRPTYDAKRHPDPIGRFSTMHWTDRQTDRPTDRSRESLMTIAYTPLTRATQPSNICRTLPCGDVCMCGSDNWRLQSQLCLQHSDHTSHLPYICLHSSRVACFTLVNAVCQHSLLLWPLRSKYAPIIKYIRNECQEHKNQAMQNKLQ